MSTKDLLTSYITELRRGSLIMAVLGCLHQPQYGYELLQTLKQKGIEIEANTLYPLLRRLDKQGVLHNEWDTSESRPRKYYKISVEGERLFQELVVEWSVMQQSMEGIIHEQTKA